MTPAETTTRRSRYEVERTLGRGGMATVYLAHDTVLDRRVALKVLAEHLAEDGSFRARFIREARLAARVAHPNVVRVFDAFADERGLCIAMEYVEGETLAEELHRRGPLPPAEAIDLGVQLCSALAAAHDAGLVHRDVKPQNILRAPDGTVKLGDFGIARSHDSTALTEHGSVLGTAAYLSPEQARGRPVTAAADLYALGVVLYEALTGRQPHEGASLPELLLRREQEAPAPPSALVAGVPPELDRAILACLALRPEDRPASASALAAQLAAALPEAPTRPLPGPTDTRATAIMATQALPRRTTTVRRGLVAAIVLAVLAGVGLALALLTTGGSGGTPARTAARAATQPVTTAPTTTASVRKTTAPVTPTRAAPVSPCTTIDSRSRQLDARRHALDAQKHATKDKSARKALDRQRHALDDQRHALDREKKACH